MTTAFVLSGGGSLGAVQVGMLDALAERDIAPDLLVGTSVGAINAAYIARRGFDRSVVGDLAAIWRGLRRHDVFPLEPLRLAAAAVGRAPSLCSDGALRRLVTSHAGDGRLEELALPVHVIATDVTSGVEVVLSSGDAVQAVMASAAIPAVFPSVHIDGRYLVDGGVSNNAPVSHALSSGADVVYVLPTGFACALDDPPTSPLASAVQALTLARHGRRLVVKLHEASAASGGESGGEDEWLLVMSESSDESTIEALGLAFKLTAREAEVLYWVVQGKTNRDIGDILGTSPRTVHKHLEHVFEKLGVETRTAAAGLAMARVRQLTASR